MGRRACLDAVWWTHLKTLHYFDKAPGYAENIFEYSYMAASNNNGYNIVLLYFTVSSDKFIL